MTQPSPAEYNPFMLLLDPEAVLAAVEKSERLSRLDRHLCRPLDKPVAPAGAQAADGSDEADRPALPWGYESYGTSLPSS